MQDPSLFKTNMTIKEFCNRYAVYIDYLVDKSHNFKSPKIEANYDDWSEKTVRPVNSTIFYYFYSMDKAKRNVASWLLAAANYPNQHMRAAYMKFFSQ
jgi:hypothetical protein